VSPNNGRRYDPDMSDPIVGQVYVILMNAADRLPPAELAIRLDHNGDDGAVILYNREEFERLHSRRFALISALLEFLALQKELLGVIEKMTCGPDAREWTIVFADKGNPVEGLHMIFDAHFGK